MQRARSQCVHPPTKRHPEGAARVSPRLKDLLFFPPHHAACTQTAAATLPWVGKNIAVAQPADYHVRSMEKRFYTYIIASKARVLYTGTTSNISKRVWEHRNGVHDGFSRNYRCTRLVWYEAYNTPQRAIAREKEIKGWTRAKKIALIEAENPTWEDLAEDWFKPLKAVLKKQRDG